MEVICDDNLVRIFGFLGNASWSPALCTSKRWLRIGRRVFDPSAQRNRALIWGCMHGYHNLVKELVKDPRVDVSARNCYVLRWACKEGLLEVVKQVLKDKRVDPTCDENSALILASSFGHHEIVSHLLDDGRADPSVFENIALKWSSTLGHLAVVKELLKDNKVTVNQELLETIYENLKKTGKLDEGVETLISIRTWNL